MPLTLMAPRSWQGNFRRPIMNKDPKHADDIDHWVEFAPGEPIEVTDEELKTIRKDIGRPLLVIEFDERGRPVPLPPEDQEAALNGKPFGGKGKRSRVKTDPAAPNFNPALTGPSEKDLPPDDEDEDHT